MSGKLKGSALMRPLVVLVLPGMYLFYKYSQYKQERQEKKKRKLTERELSHLNHKIDTPLFCSSTDWPIECTQVNDRSGERDWSMYHVVTKERGIRTNDYIDNVFTLMSPDMKTLLNQYNI